MEKGWIHIRIFDLCYFLTGLLAEETKDAFTKKEWLESVRAVVAGHESIEILFAAYFLSMNDAKHADDAY